MQEQSKRKEIKVQVLTSISRKETTSYLELEYDFFHKLTYIHMCDKCWDLEFPKVSEFLPMRCNTQIPYVQNSTPYLSKMDALVNMTSSAEMTVFVLCVPILGLGGFFQTQSFYTAVFDISLYFLKKVMEAEDAPEEDVAVVGTVRTGAGASSDANGWFWGQKFRTSYSYRRSKRSVRGTNSGKFFCFFKWACRIFLHSTWLKSWGNGS